MILDIIKHAKQLLFDNTKSGLAATNTQDAIDELKKDLIGLIGYPDVTNKIQTITWCNEFAWIATQNCWAYVLLNTNKNDTSSYVTLNGAIVLQIFDSNKSHSTQVGVFLPCKRGDVIKKPANGDTLGQVTVYGVR